jgi:UDP-2,3-diacylglucosamine pyrophosphatase LpxH
VISDFHLSRGRWLKNGKRNPLEDFHEDDRFREFLDHYSGGDYTHTDVELIVNGDFFDPLAVIPLPEPGQKLKTLEFPLEVEEPAAVHKFTAIMDGHPVVMEALRLFLRRGKKIVFRWGNHDAAILWPAVQALIRERLLPPTQEQLIFMQEAYIFDRICVDHGHQLEALNHFDETNMFIERKTKSGMKRIQNLPFGSFFVLGFLNRVKLQRSYINQVYPFGTYLRFSLWLEPTFFLMNGLRVGWFFIKMRFITHPMRFARLRKTFLLLIEIFKRVSLEDLAEEFLTGPKADELPYDTLIMGHNHQATARVLPGGKMYMNTGTWIPITSLEMGSLGHHKLRTYALIEYQPDGKARPTLKVWNGSPRISEDFG